MPTSPDPAVDTVGFADFVLDLRSRELWRGRTRVPLQHKSFLVLRALLQRPGTVVTRDELVAALWPDGYFVDAEHGLNTAVRRLRAAIHSSDEPHLIETVPRVGYRLAAHVAVTAGPVPAPGSTTERHRVTGDTALEPANGPAPSGPAARLSLRLLGVAFVMALTVVAAGVLWGRRPGPSTPAPADAVEELLARARYLRNVKRLADARQFVEQARTLAPLHPQVLAGLALGLLGEGRDDDARAMAMRALAADEGTWEAHRALGTLALAAGDFRSAEQHLRRAIDTGPADAKSHTRFARHLLQIGRFDDARGAILAARRIAPDDPDVQNIWMEYALRTGDFASAVREGERWLTIWAPQIAGTPTPVVRDMLGLAYLGRGRDDDARAQFRAIDATDDLREALVLAHAGRDSDARAILDAHEARGNPADPGHHGAMAMAYVALGQHEQALAHLHRQLDAHMYPGWLHCQLFEGIRAASGYPDLERRIDREFFSGATGSPPDSLARIRRAGALEYWPRPLRAGHG